MQPLANGHELPKRARNRPSGLALKEAILQGSILVHARQHSVAKGVEVERTLVRDGKHLSPEDAAFIRICCRIAVKIAGLDICARDIINAVDSFQIEGIKFSAHL